MRFPKSALIILSSAAMGAMAHGQDNSDASPSPTPHHRHTHTAVAKSESDDHNDATPTPSPTSNHKKKSVNADEAALSKLNDEETTPSPSPTPTASPRPRGNYGPDASVDTGDLKEYTRLDAPVQGLIQSALALTRQSLTYTYGSADPANGGMDCSGFIYYILSQSGLKDVPRDSAEQYEWVWKSGSFRAVNSRGLDGFELEDLKPGDLLFWTGTYATDRDPPITHTMLYLGREKSTGDRVMVGSSDGRSYHGIQRWGVSVFDFKSQPVRSGSNGYSGSRFIGYGPVPGF